MIFLDNCTHKSISHEKTDNDASAKWKEVKGKPKKINEMILTAKVDLKEGPDNINGHPWIIFYFSWLVIIWREVVVGGSFKIGRPRSRGWNNIGRKWTRVMGGLESWTIFMDVICGPSLTWHFRGERGCGKLKWIIVQRFDYLYHLKLAWKKEINQIPSFIIIKMFN